MMKDQKTSVNLNGKFLDYKGIEVPIFVITLSTPREIARKTRLTNRLKYHDIISSVTFIDGVSIEDKETKEVLKDYTGSTLPEAACMMSHLKAIATFLLTSKNEYGLILESDAVPINTIKSDFIEVTKNIPSGTSLIMLNVYISGFGDIIKKNNIFQTIGQESYSALAYMISRNYAEMVMKKFCGKYIIEGSEIKMTYKPFNDYSLDDCLILNKSKPKSLNNKRVTSEIITIKSGGLSTIKQLFIDESLDTSIQHQQHTQWHLEYYKQFDHVNYADADIACEHTEILKLWSLI